MPQKEERIPEDLVFVCSLNNTTPAGNNMTFTCLLFASYFNLRVKGLLGLLGFRVWLMKAYCIRILQPYNPITMCRKYINSVSVIGWLMVCCHQHSIAAGSLLLCLIFSSQFK